MIAMTATETIMEVNVAGHTKTLRVVSLASACGKIKNGVGFEFDDEGGWVVALEDLEKIVAMAKEFQSKLKEEPSAYET